MAFVFEERGSDSPLIDQVISGRSVGEGSTVRPSEIHWHLVLSRFQGQTDARVVGPWETSGTVDFTDGVELVWVRFRLGAYMPHLPTRKIINSETVLPDASGRSFWLDGCAWQYPNFDNVDIFINRLAREEILVRDPLVEAVLQGRPPATSPRTVRHHFLHATGLTQAHITQYQRAMRAAALLEQGTPILDAVEELGYFDQPHLTRSLKKFVGKTPGKI